MDEQYQPRKADQSEKALPIIDLIVLAVIIVGTIVFMVIAVSSTFNAYKFPVRSLLDVFSIITVFELLILSSKLIARKRRAANRRVSSDYKILKSLCVLITIIGLLNAPMFFFDAGSTRPGSFFERREYIATRNDLTVARVCDKDGYHYEAISYCSIPCKGEVYPGTYAIIEYVSNGKTGTVKFE